MRIKDKFEMIYSKIGSIENIVDISSETLNRVVIDDDDQKYLNILAGGYAKAKGSGDFVLNNINKCMAVRMPNYPLPGFVSKNGAACINLSILTSDHVSDYSSADIFSMYLYSLSLNSYVKNKPFDKHVEEVVTDFIFATFMKLFAKKYGLQGSYQYLIPNLQGVIALYINSAFMGNEITKRTIDVTSNKYYIDLNKLNLEFDFSSIQGLFKALRFNNILPITENVFSTTILNVAGISSVPMFEDISRFFATINAASVSGGLVFSSFFRKVNPRLFERILEIGMKAAKR